MIKGDAVSFGSDNHAGVHPSVLEAIARANVGFTPAYGSDPWTARLREVLKSEFGSHAVAYPVFNGTGANVVALSSVLKRYESVIAAEKAHVDADEAGAPERIGGFKLLTIPAANQKLTPAAIQAKLDRRGDTHAVQPHVVSITNSTELGTVYSLSELRALGDYAKAEGLLLHIDGSRLSNAAASLGCSLGECTTAIGADLLSLGGTKNGLLGAETVLLLSASAASQFKDDLRYVHKQSMQLASKMRFFSAELLALFEGDLWRRNASQANAMAKRLEAEVSGVVEIVQPVEANAVFARVPVDILLPLQAKFRFYTWDASEATHAGHVIVRWMTSWQTTEADVVSFAQAIKKAIP